MKTVILAGGKGLRYNNSDIPKPLAMIGDRPIIQHVMDIYSNQGFNDFILALGYKKNTIIDYFNIIEHDYNIEFVDTGEESNTAHRIKLIEEYISKDDEHFFCTYSDGLSNVNLNKLQNFHQRNKYIATLTAVRPQNIYGILNIGFNGRVTKFNEKPMMNDYINGGFFVFNRDIFNHISLNNRDLEIDILPSLCYEGMLGAHKHEGYWNTVNTIKDQMILNDIYNDYKKNNKELPWEVRTH